MANSLLLFAFLCAALCAHPFARQPSIADLQNSRGNSRHLLQTPSPILASNSLSMTDQGLASSISTSYTSPMDMEGESEFIKIVEKVKELSYLWYVVISLCVIICLVCACCLFCMFKAMRANRKIKALRVQVRSAPQLYQIQPNTLSTVSSKMHSPRSNFSDPFSIACKSPIPGVSQPGSAATVNAGNSQVKPEMEVVYGGTPVQTSVLPPTWNQDASVDVDDIQFSSMKLSGSKQQSNSNTNTNTHTNTITNTPRTNTKTPLSTSALPQSHSLHSPKMWNQQIQHMRQQRQPQAYAHGPAPPQHQPQAYAQAWNPPVQHQPHSFPSNRPLSSLQQTVFPPRIEQQRFLSSNSASFPNRPLSFPAPVPPPPAAAPPQPHDYEDESESSSSASTVRTPNYDEVHVNVHKSTFQLDNEPSASDGPPRTDKRRSGSFKL